MSGRNFDYGSQMSNSKEGEMAKRTLITMAKDLHELYCSLNNEDDLPSWCHYKLAKSQVELQSVTNYLTSKISKLCLDEEVPESYVKLSIQNNMNDEYISEGIFDFLNKSSKKSDIESKKKLRKMHNPDVSHGKNYVNETIKFINLSTKIAAIVRNISGDASYELDKVENKVPKDSLNLLKIVKDECVKIESYLKPKKSFVPNISSARKTRQKTPWYKKLMFREDYSVNTKNIFLTKLESHLDSVGLYFDKKINSEQDVKRIQQLSVYNEQDINSLLEDLRFTIKTLNDFISKEEDQENERFNKNY